MQKQKITRSAKISKPSVPQTAGKLRIIGGIWRSRQLPVIDAEGLRPTTDRVRETLFNWLQSDLPFSRCLDLFAGSGALGLEAASRGASDVVMVENSAPVYQVLEQNIKRLDASQVSVVKQDALHYLQQLAPQDSVFDIVFLDPPYQSGLLEPVIEALALSKGAKVYLEAKKGDDTQVPDNWLLLRDKVAGQIHYRLYEIES